MLFGPREQARLWTEAQLVVIQLPWEPGNWTDVPAD